MRKTAVALGAWMVLCVVMAMPALADSSLPQPHGGPTVLGAGGTGGAGGTVFTGSAISPALLALALLSVIGAASLALLQRRRAAH